jgi:UDP-N-acetylglucosamine--N-acetylmuramyl-(pentapeptide) pyrophosphoryl-undecaprenol N-acetylglucosamine transferase
VLWGTGESHAATYAERAQPGRVAVRGFFDPMAVAYRAADLVVCRAGAMTTAELCAWGKPSVLVPLPSAAADHQSRNASTLATAGAAVHLAERDVTSEELSRLVTGLLADPDRLEALARAARERGRPHAAREIVSRLLTLAP